MEVFQDWRGRWSMLCKIDDHWHVLLPSGGDGLVHHRPLRWWSPRDLIRIPLHHWWARRYF